jgi:tetratricopeptide (TPR) repeat protein
LSVEKKARKSARSSRPSAEQEGEGRDRRFRVPPPLTRGQEPFEGAEILEEIPTELGGLLWNSLRNVTLWARAVGEDPSQLFAEGAAERRLEDLGRMEIPQDLSQPLYTIARLLGNPEHADADEVARACRTIAAWAMREGCLGTAVAYLQAAVLVRPTDAAAAYEVGRLTRKRAEGPRAETWFHYAINQGRRTGDWESYALSYVGLGNLRADRGNFPAARRALSRALRASRRHGHRHVEAMALHDLFATAIHTESVRAAERLVVQAAEAYGPDHPRLPHLAHDMAFLWMKKRYFGHALRIFERLRARISGFESVLLAANTARAAAGAGQKGSYERAQTEAEAMIPAWTTHEGLAAVLVSLAHAAMGVGDRSRAIDLAERALSVTERTREGKMRLEAESILDQAKPRELAQVDTDGTRTPPSSTEHVAEILGALLSAGAV